MAPTVQELSQQGHVELRASRMKWALIWLCCFCAIVGTLFVMRSGPVVAWVSILFFGIGVTLSTWQLISPSRLLIDADGFTVVQGFRPHRTAWTDVERFAAYELMTVIGPRFVYYNYVPSRRPAGAALNRAVSDFDAGLPDTYGLPARDLAMLLEAFRTRASQQRAQPVEA